MWTLFNQAKTWRTRPSNLLAIEDAYAAFCLDEAVWTFGSEVEGMLQDVKVGKNAKPEAREAAQRQLLQRILTGKNQYREPPSPTK